MIKVMKKLFMSEVFYIIFIVVISSVLRLTYLDRIPTAIGQDEIDYQLTSKSIAISGKDISGTISPIDILQFHYPPTDSPKAELPYFLNLPVMWITDFSLLSARITFALISIMTVVIFYFVSKYFFGKEIGMIAGLLFAINPWEIFIGRTSFEVIPALFFFLLFFYLFLIFDKWKLIMTIPIILCAFYSYVATKIILFPFLLSIIYYLYFVEKRTKNKYQYLLIILLTFGISALFYFSIHSQGNSRIGDIFSPFSSNISNEVNELRKNTITTETLPRGMCSLGKTPAG
jgi:4-amino-4-deoxy-L-arabinose transferase-like glycosyltransferase